MGTVDFYFVLLLMYCVSCDVTSAQSEEESLRLAWAVRRLVGTTKCNSSSGVPFPYPFYYPPARPGNIGPIGPQGLPGPIGPKGDTGICECDQREVENLKQTVLDLQSEISNMKYLMPEQFCLLGMKSGKIPDSAITVSSLHSAEYCQIANARLDHQGAWCPTESTIGQWIEVDLGKIQKVTGVVTQGQGIYPSKNEWVTSFKVEYGIRADSKTSITENDRTKVFCSTNFNKNTKVVTRFPEPVNARYIRILPVSSSGRMSMRFDVINC